MNESRKQEIKRLLDQQREALDSDEALSRRLSQARANALNPSKSKRAHLEPVFALSGAALLIMVLSLSLLLPEAADTPVSIDPFSLQELELVSQLEHFEQDMDFYYWLEETDATSG
jgi:hypothetical protein